MMPEQRRATLLYSAEQVAQAARDCAVFTAMVLVRENGDPEAAIELCCEFTTPVEGSELLDVSAVASLAIREALEMGVTPRA